MKGRVIYSYTIEDDIVCIVDSDEGLSVTNGIEQVLDELHIARVDLTLPVIYRDTMGIWDQIIVKKGGFHSFRSIGERDKEKAKRKVKERR